MTAAPVSRRARSVVRDALRRVGLEVTRYRPTSEFPADFDPETIATIRAVRPYTMTSVARLDALCRAVRHVVANRIPGAIVECGVWRGGSMMAAARTLLEAGDTSRDLYLFDTFEGMPPPTGTDLRYDGVAAESLLAAADPTDVDSTMWCVADLDDVRRNLLSTGYPAERLHFVKGLVEDTVPVDGLDEIALLRLDTDWYESTRHELTHLAPRMAPGAVLVIDDYGFWQGARRAVDEWVAALEHPLFLHRIDHTGRLAVMPHALGEPARPGATDG